MGSIGFTKGTKCINRPRLNPTKCRPRLIKNLKIKGVIEKEGEGVESIPMVTSSSSGDEGEGEKPTLCSPHLPPVCLTICPVVNTGEKICALMMLS